VWEKGFDLLIEAIALMRDPRVHVTIVGDGTLRDELQRLTLHLGVASQVHFVGFHKNPYPFFKIADAFVLSSRIEGMPNVILEALACGTGVIAVPATGGTRELLEGRLKCALAESVSALSLAQALRSYEFTRRADRIHFKLEEYTVENVCRSYAEIFLKVAGRQT
jgi:glycosyltransferase involved in cell wall biosynthesis